MRKDGDSDRKTVVVTHRRGNDRRRWPRVIVVLAVAGSVILLTAVAVVSAAADSRAMWIRAILGRPVLARPFPAAYSMLSDAYWEFAAADVERSARYDSTLKSYYGVTRNRARETRRSFISLVWTSSSIKARSCNRFPSPRVSQWLWNSLNYACDSISRLSFFHKFSTIINIEKITVCH